MTKFTTTALTPAATTKFAGEDAGGNKGHNTGTQIAGIVAGIANTFTVIQRMGAGDTYFMHSANNVSEARALIADAPDAFGRGGVVFGTTSGGSGSSSYVGLVTNDYGVERVERWRVESTGHFRPLRDNSYTIGNGSFRASTVYAGTGTINTSDAREKTPLRPLEPAEIAAVRRVMAGIGIFQWLAAVDEKGAEKARLHVGVTAQAVRDAFEAEGLDPGRYGLFCADPLVELYEVEPERKIPATKKDPARLIPARYEERPVVDADGNQIVRLGVRQDQIVMLALAALFSPAA